MRMRKDELFRECVSHWRKHNISHIQARERKVPGGKSLMFVTNSIFERKEFMF